MNFEDMKIKSIDCAVRFTAKSDDWVAKNRKWHIIGIELSGKSVHDFGFQKYTLEANDLLFFNQKDDYVVNVLERGSSLSVHFTTYEDIDTPSFCLKDAGTPEIVSLLERMVKESAVAGNDFKMAELFYRLCGMFEAARKKAYSKKDLRMISAGEYLDRNYREEGCIDNAADISGITRRRFNDLFKSSFGITPNRYVTKQKIEYAKQLLCLNELSVSEISEICGFSDIYYFSKVFKGETGLSPREYRTKNEISM